MHPSVWTAAAMEKITPSGTRVSHLDNNIPLVFAAKKKENNRAPAAELGTALWLASLLIKASLPSPSPKSSSLKSS